MNRLVLFATFILPLGLVLVILLVLPGSVRVTTSSPIRTPVIALMPDIIPSALRSQANGVINFMGGVGAIIAFLVGSSLYEKSPDLPFWVGAALIVLPSA